MQTVEMRNMGAPNARCTQLENEMTDQDFRLLRRCEDYILLGGDAVWSRRRVQTSVGEHNASIGGA